MKISKINLRNLFSKGQKPNQEAFWNFFDSFWHKDEEIDQAAVKGLESTLANKLDKGVETTLLDAFNEAVSNVNSILKGEATPTSSPTPWVPGSPDLYEKWEARTVGVYTNFKDGSTPPQPIEITAADLEEKLVFINMSNGVAKKDPVSIPGAAIDQSFAIANTNKAQNAKNINGWLVNDVKGGESDEVKVVKEEIGDFYANIGINLNGSTPDGLEAGAYNVKSNSTAVANANKYLASANIRLAAAGKFKFVIGRFVDNKFNVRWESSEKSGVVGWNNYSFTSEKVKINAGEMAAVFCLSSSTAQIYFGDPGATGNRFVQYSTISGGTSANLGSYYALWFELLNIDEIVLPSDAVFNLSKSVSKIVNDFSQNGYTGLESVLGQAVVSSDSTAGEGYAINKIDLTTSYSLEKLEITTITAGMYNIAVGFLDQYEKFIEKRIIEKSLTAGLNTVTFEPIILEKGDFVGLKTPGKLPVNTSPQNANLFVSNSYLGTLQKQPGKSLPIKLYLKEFISSPVATKAEIADVNGSIEGLQQNFMLNGKKVDLKFNPDGTVDWAFNEGYDSILVIGNSLAIHPITTKWWGLFGMAASKRENDYAHRILAKMKVYKPNATLKVITLAGWEVDPVGYDKSQNDNDIIGMKVIFIRLGENATYNSDFKTRFAELIDYIRSKAPEAKIVIGGVFWTEENKDSAMKSVADARNIPFIKMDDLNVAENRSAIGNQVMGDDGLLHTINDNGVASHPGDLGHERIAVRNMAAIGL